MTGPNEIDETTSLLAAHDCENGMAPTDSTSGQPTDHGRRTVVLCGLFVILFQFADILRFAPTLHLLELGYCRNYYLEHKHDPRLIDPSGHILERFCKVRQIQEDLSSIRAWLGFVEGLVGGFRMFCRDALLTFHLGLVLVIPYGMLSEKIGGRLVAALNLFGYALSSVWIVVICESDTSLPTCCGMICSPLKVSSGRHSPSKPS